MNGQHKYLIIFSILLFSLNCQILNAQTVSGIIKDAKTNEALFGATVVIKGTTIGGLTDIDGKFSFSTTNTPPLFFPYLILVM